MPKGRVIAALTAVGVCIAVAAWLYDRHHFAVLWPAKVQAEVAGSTLATDKSLVSSERHFTYGEGFARWQYSVEHPSAALQRLCGAVDVRRCTFSRSRRVDEGVDLNVVLSEGVLTVEEIWS